MVGFCSFGDRSEPGCNPGVVLHARGYVLRDDDPDHLAHTRSFQEECALAMDTSWISFGWNGTCEAACDIHAPCIYSFCLHLCLQEVFLELD